jgi:flagellar hook-associated protein 2
MTINLGNIVTQGGKQVASGIASNLDVDAIVTSLVDAKKIPVTKLTDTVKLYDEKTAALGEFRTKLETLQTASDYLRNKSGFNAASNNIFEYRTSSLSISSGLTVSNFAEVTVNPGTAVGNYSLEINNIAKAYASSSQSFASKTVSVTEAASGTTSGLFSAGTVTIHSGKVAFSQNDTLENSEYGDYGTGAGVVTAAGYYNFNTLGTIDPKLIGQPSTVTAVVNGSNVDVSMVFNGRTYTASVAANAGGDGLSIANSSALNFRNTDTGMGFSLTTSGGDYLINGSGANATAFANAINSGLSAVHITQSREVDNFDSTELTDTVIQGLTSSDIKLVSDDWDINDRSHGFMSEFTVTPVSVSGASDATISVKIDNETYTATGLGGGTNVINSNLTLTGTTGKTLKINLGDRGISVSIADSTDADELESALNAAFQVEDADIEISEGDKLVDIAAAFNSKSNVSNVTASIVAVTASDFRLLLKSSEVGVDNQFQFTDTSGVLTNVSFSTLQAAEDAQIVLDGNTITRGTNTIDDVVTGMSVKLLQETDGDTISINVEKDVSAAKAGIINFINAYNDLRTFQAKHLQRDSAGELSEDSKLSDSTVLKNTIIQLADELTSAIAGVTDADISGIASIGISFIDFEGDEETNAANDVLTFDDQKLTDALTDNYNAVRQLFEYSFNSDSDNVLMSSRTNSTTLTAYKLDIDLTRTGHEVKVRHAVTNAELFEMDIEELGTSGSYRFVGKEDTSLEGAVLLYTGDGTDTVNVTSSQGFADRFYNLIHDTLDETDGAIKNELDFIADSKDSKNQDIDALNITIETYRLQLLEQFTDLESAISKVNTLLSFLTAQAASLNGNNE